MEFFEIYEVKPCADYEGVTLEGKISDDTMLCKIILYLDEIVKRKISLDEGKIRIYYREDFTIYLYDDGKIIMSKLDEEKIGLDFLKGISGNC